MKENPARPRGFDLTPSRCGARTMVVVMCSAVFLLAGCAAVRRKPSFSWSTAVQVRPKLPSATSTGIETPVDPGPELRIAIPAPPSAIAVAHSNPPRPRVAGNTSAESLGAGKAEAPVIVPELTGEETVAAQKQTGQSLGAAERNLAAARRKTLNAAQSDLASKVQSFLSEAHDAARASDWIRARDLAKKAQVLSEELVNSL